MKKMAQYELGSVQIHNNVLNQIVQSAISEIDGVSLTPKDFTNKFLEYLGHTSHPSIEIHINDKEEVTLDVKVLIRYGLHIPDVARLVQEAVKQAIDKTVNINLKQINVNIQGIERGQKCSVKINQ